MSKKISLSGFTILRNIIKYEYPFLESIQSLLPLVDEMVIGLGDSSDETEALVRKIASPKIKIFNYKWDENLVKDGVILSKATNFALQQTKGDWCFYLQADEIVHEQEYSSILNTISKASEKNYQAISFKYYHFKGDYWSINPWAYGREIRIIKNNQTIHSVGDACTFHLIEKPKHPRTFKSTNHIYHYGWVKPPHKMIEKSKYFESLYHGKLKADQKYITINEENIFDEVEICREFKGKHPKVMQKRVKQFPKIQRKKKRWFYWNLYKKWFKYGWV